MKRFFLATSLLFYSFYGYTQRTLIHCGYLIDGKSRVAQTEMTVVIEGDHITGVAKGFSVATTGDEVIDLSKKTVMPGLIDLHVHIESETSKDQALHRFTLNEADIAFRATMF